MKVCLSLISMLLFISFSSVYSMDWKISDARIRAVFKPVKKNGQLELIRLFNNGSFEHLIYEDQDQFSIVKRNTGKYDLASGRLKLHGLELDFGSDIYEEEFYIDGHAYENKLQSMFKKKNYVLRKSNKNTYDHPFFLDPRTGQLIANKEAAENIDFELLVNYITREARSEEQRLELITNFIQQSIDYDHDGAETDDFYHDQRDYARILTSNRRVAVCSGYSYILKALGEFAGLEVEYVGGYAKQGGGYNGSLGDPHAWNIVKVGEEFQIHDITWGGVWQNVDPAVMIHSHFPDIAEYQLLDQPVTQDEFRSMVYIEPKRKGAEYIAFIPARGELNAKDQLQLLFDGSLAGLRINTWEQETNAGFGPKQEISNFSVTSTGGKSLLTIPINFNKGMIRLKLDKMNIELMVTNNGKIEPDLATFYEHNKIKYYTRSDQWLTEYRSHAGKDQVTLLSNPVRDQMLSSEERFLNDLAVSGFYDLDALKHPLISEIRQYYGLREISGRKHNKQVVRFFRETGHRDIKNDEVAWCSAIICYCAKRIGVKYPSSATAKSWLSHGMKVSSPEVGDLVIFWRESPKSWKGHVGIYLGKDPITGDIICLGGNQNDEVNVSKYSSEKVSGYRRIVK